MAKMTELHEAATPGMLNALNRQKNRTVCECGFPVPVYKGRYPKKCPMCQKDLGNSQAE